MATWHRYILALCTLACVTAVCISATEQHLAGIKLGMTKAEVKKLLQSPHGRLMAFPAYEVRLDDPVTIVTGSMMGGMNGGPFAPSTQKPPNTLLFHDYRTNKEVVIGNSSITDLGAGADPSGSGMGGGSMISEQMGEGNPFAKLPLWAYTVHANMLRLDQEQYLYKINETCSLGITFSRQGNVDKVTDIAICSYEPTKIFPKTSKQQKVTTVNTTLSSNKKVTLSSATQRRIRLGSKYADVLSMYGWPKFTYPFATDLVIKQTGPSTGSMKVPYFQFVTSAGSDTVTPDPELWQDIAKVPGDHPIRITDGKSYLYNSGFSKNAVVLYPEAGVAFTLVNFTVVRIQVGNGVVTPPPVPSAPKAPEGVPGMGGGAPGGSPGGFTPGGPSTPSGGIFAPSGGGGSNGIPAAAPGDSWF